MMEIINRCPVCGSKSILKFRASDRNDLPEGPWAVPCTACQTRILDALHAIGCDRDAEKVQINLVMNCQKGNEASICIARNLLAVVENALTASTTKTQRQAS